MATEEGVSEAHCTGYSGLLLRAAVVISTMSTASFEALSCTGDRTKQGSKVIHQTSTRNLCGKLEHCV